MATLGRPIQLSSARASSPSDPPESPPPADTDTPEVSVVSVAASTMEPSDLVWTREKDGEVVLATNSTLSTQVDLPQRPTAVTIRARGELGGGEWPRMELRLGDTVVGTVTVDSDEERQYRVAIDEQAFPPTAGAEGPMSLPLTVSFVNDFYDPEIHEDRNLYVREVEISAAGQPW